MSKILAPESLETRIHIAVQHYWSVRQSQASKQAKRGVSDQGARSAVTGGKQMDGFVELTRDVLMESGLPEDTIFYNRGLELPGYYRPTKKWDIVVVSNQQLVAAIEMKSIGSSFGNNMNNRAEESIGSAQDILTAYREGAMPARPKPWLGYLMLFVKSEASTHPVRVSEPHFEVFPEFKEASYMDRGRILLTKLMRERLYDATCFLLTPRPSGASETPGYMEPDPDLSVRNFLLALRAQAQMFVEMQQP
jgi:hypothetical protein